MSFQFGHNAQNRAERQKDKKIYTCVFLKLEVPKYLSECNTSSKSEQFG